MKKVFDMNGVSYDVATIHELDRFPNGTVFKNLYLEDLTLSRLPDNLIVKNDLRLRGTTGLTTLPPHTEVGNDLDLQDSDIETLPDGLTVNGCLWLNNCKLTRLPNNLTVNNVMDFRDTDIHIREIGTNCYIKNFGLNDLGIITNTLACDTLYISNYEKQLLDFSKIRAREVVLELSQEPAKMVNLNSSQLRIREKTNPAVPSVSLQIEASSLETVVANIPSSTELSLFLVKTFATSIRIIRKGLRNDRSGKLTTLKLNDVKATVILELDQSLKGTIAIQELSLTGNFEVSEVSGSGKGVVLPDYGILYGNMDIPKDLPVPNRFCCLGTITYQ